MLTEQRDTARYAASFETAARAKEDALFTNIGVTAFPISQISGQITGLGNGLTYPADPTTSPNDYTSRLEGGGNRLGATLALKVMAGDKVDIGVKAWVPGTTPGEADIEITTNDLLASLLGALTNGAAGLSSNKATPGELSGGSSPMPGGISSFLSSHNDIVTPSPPKAYLNWILFDEQFNYVPAGSGFMRVGYYSDASLQTLATNGLPVAKSGYLFVYLSNESKKPVFFDNLVVQHYTGPLVEENAYYPFGLVMSGISSKAAGKVENKCKYNSIELNMDFDLNIYDAYYRNLDPQLGRFWQIDPKPNELFSPYAAMANNPILFSDPLGDTTWIYGNDGRFMGMMADAMENQIHFLDRTIAEGVTPTDFSQMSLEDQTNYANSFRKESVAFIGNKTMADMKSIVKSAGKKEVLFTGTVSEDKEIRLSAVKTAKGEYAQMQDVDKALDNDYTKEQQSKFFLVGHTHQQKPMTGLFSQVISDPLRHYGVPSSPNAGSSGDYGPYLYRSSTATQRGQSPALIASHYGFTVYGTAASAQPGLGSSNFNVIGAVVPKTESYYLYKQLKK